MFDAADINYDEFISGFRYNEFEAMIIFIS